MAGRKKQYKQPTGSRHLDRHMVSLPGDIYDLMQALAAAEDRNLRQQVLVACREHLKSKGRWPEGEQQKGG